MSLLAPIGRSVWTGFVDEVDSEVDEVDGGVHEVDDGQGQLWFATSVEGRVSRRAYHKKKNEPSPRRGSNAAEEGEATRQRRTICGGFF